MVGEWLFLTGYVGMHRISIGWRGVGSCSCHMNNIEPSFSIFGIRKTFAFIKKDIRVEPVIAKNIQLPSQSLYIKL
jgi:hypothetical protein